MMSSRQDSWKQEISEIFNVCKKKDCDMGLWCGSNLVSTSDYTVCGKWQNLILKSELVSLFPNLFLFYLFTIWLFPILSPPFLCSSLFFIPTYVSSFIGYYAPSPINYLLKINHFAKYMIHISLILLSIPWARHYYFHRMDKAHRDKWMVQNLSQ